MGYVVVSALCFLLGQVDKPMCSAYKVVGSRMDDRVQCEARAKVHKAEMLDKYAVGRMWGTSKMRWSADMTECMTSDAASFVVGYVAKPPATWKNLSAAE